MSEIFVLIMLVMTTSNVSNAVSVVVIQQEFFGKAACEFALQDIAAQQYRFNKPTKFPSEILSHRCYPKSSVR